MKLKFSVIKKRYLLLVFILIIIVFGYWLKSQIGINLFDQFSIGSYFPFNYLTTNVIRPPKSGILLDEDFDTKRIFKQWQDLWMREKGAVTNELSSDGFNGSRCLLIRSDSKGSWTYAHNKLIEVKNGDLFYFEGLVNINGNNLSAYLSVAAFDENKKAIDWNLFKGKVNRNGAWIRVKKQLIISDDKIKYVSFRLVGIGVGEYRFDDIIFRKIK